MQPCLIRIRSHGHFQKDLRLSGQTLDLHVCLNDVQSAYPPLVSAEVALFLIDTNKLPVICGYCRANQQYSTFSQTDSMQHLLLMAA